MGTKSITKVFNECNEVILAMYRQFDGYLSGHGQELIDFLEGRTVVNGLRIKVVDGVRVFSKEANGMGCLAAQIVAHFKKQPGSIYIVKSSAYELYNYDVFINLHGKIALRATTADGEVIIEGVVDKLKAEQKLQNLLK